MLNTRRLAAAGALALSMLGLAGCVSPGPYPYRRVYYQEPAVVYARPYPGYYRYGYGYGYRRPYGW